MRRFDEAGQGRVRKAHVTVRVDVEDFDDYLFINLRGPFLAIQSAVPHMLARGGGRIVNIASMAALVGLKYAAPYCAVKGGLHCARSFAWEDTATWKPTERRSRESTFEQFS